MLIINIVKISSKVRIQFQDLLHSQMSRRVWARDPCLLDHKHSPVSHIRTPGLRSFIQRTHLHIYLHAILR